MGKTYFKIAGESHDDSGKFVAQEWLVPEVVPWISIVGAMSSTQEQEFLSLIAALSSLWCFQ